MKLLNRINSIKMSPLFIEFIHTGILVLALDKRTTTRAKAIIGEVESRLAYEPMWFNIRLSFKSDIDKYQLTDTIKLRINSRRLEDMKEKHSSSPIR